jgi:hypothetical protein
MCDWGDLRRKANPDHLATALLAAVEGGILLAQVRRDPAPLETAPQAPTRAGPSVSRQHFLSRRVGCLVEYMAPQRNWPTAKVCIAGAPWIAASYRTRPPIGT